MRNQNVVSQLEGVMLLNAEKYCLFGSDGETRVAAHQANAAMEISVSVFLD